jgi:hypothetical protein
MTRPVTMASKSFRKYHVDAADGGGIALMNGALPDRT